MVMQFRKKEPLRPSSSRSWLRWRSDREPEVSGEDAPKPRFGSTTGRIATGSADSPSAASEAMTPKLTGKSVMVTGGPSSAAIWWTESFRKRRLIWWWWITCSRKMENLDHGRASCLEISFAGRFRLRGDEATLTVEDGSFQPGGGASP